jgi:GR25 family glycosyltransferase involved in LPS biosynthesis
MLPSLRRYLACSERSLVAWILVVGTLFVAAVTLRYLSIVIEGSSSTRDRVGDSNHRMKSNFQKSSCQRLDHPPVFFNNSLDVVSRIYVISLPRRTDRRLQMDRLRDALHLNWTYKDASEANASVVTTILRQVRVLRSQLMPQSKPGGDARMRNDVIVSAFDWPHNLEDAICSQETLQPSGADLWTRPSSHSLSDLDVPAEMADPYAFNFTRSPSESVQVSAVSDPTPLACASGNDVSAASLPNLPLYRRLTPAKVACWYSHLQTIREIANGKDEAVLILEDDVDIERDVKWRLRALLDALPNDWDIVYLGKSKNPQTWTTANAGTIGHCWSDESRVPTLRNVSLRLPTGQTTLSGLHPASSPKCTHAYMLSRIGARRVVAHLRHPPFAYSRAIDQALAWLIESRRLRAFSIVPPVVVQRKIAVSDVMPGLGSAWRDELYDGVLGGPRHLP